MCPMPTQTDTVIHVRAPADLVRRIDNIAAATDRSRHYVARKLLENSLTGEDRLAALQAIADAELEASAAARTREKAPNATQVISENSTAGHNAVRAHQAIAAGGRKPR
jgi:predicted transcriptional regulator